MALFGDSNKDRRKHDHDDQERAIGRELEDLRQLRHEFASLIEHAKHVFKEIHMASQKTIQDLKDASHANDQARARLLAATDKLIEIINSEPQAPPDDEADVVGVIGELKGYTDALNAEAQKAEDAIAAHNNGGHQPPVEVPAPTLTSDVAADGGVVVHAAIDSAKATSVKFASNATDFPTQADVDAADAVTTAPFDFVPKESPIAAGSSVFVAAYALDPDGNKSELVTSQVENGDSGVQPLSRTLGGPRISPK